MNLSEPQKMLVKSLANTAAAPIAIARTSAENGLPNDYALGMAKMGKMIAKQTAQYFHTRNELGLTT